MLALLWASAVISGIVDNIPYTAIMIPVVQALGDSMPIGPLWWSLALGACLGGNGTMIGASANVVTVGLAEKAGYHIGFVEYMRRCRWPMMITVTISMIYLLIFY